MTAPTRPSRARTGLDARSPLVLDTRELGRRPGTMREVKRAVTVPQGWELPLVRVPAGSEAVLDLKLESVMEGVLVTGSLTAPLAAECGRCLEPTQASVSAPLQELFVYDAQDAGEETLPMAGDLIDLEPVARDAVVLALPVNPVCSADCPGLCPQCGASLRATGPEHSHEILDPRWSALADVAAIDLTDPTTTES
jgi:uncharacterized protein